MSPIFWRARFFLLFTLAKSIFRRCMNSAPHRFHNPMAWIRIMPGRIQRPYIKNKGLFTPVAWRPGRRAGQGWDRLFDLKLLDRRYTALVYLVSAPTFLAALRPENMSLTA